MCKRLKTNLQRNINIRPFEDKLQLKSEWLSSIRTHQSKFVNPNLITEDKKIWLEYLPNEVIPGESKFRCKFC